MIQYSFEGTVLTDPTDQKTVRCDLEVELVRETCDWLTQPVSNWLAETVSKAVAVEFDRYIAAGDLAQTIARIEQLTGPERRTGRLRGHVSLGLTACWQFASLLRVLARARNLRATLIYRIFATVRTEMR